MTVHLQRDMDDLRRELLATGALVEEATNVAEDVIFMADGEIIRHRGESLDEES
jgi:hypothetical protein